MPGGVGAIAVLMVRQLAKAIRNEITRQKTTARVLANSSQPLCREARLLLASHAIASSIHKAPNNTMMSRGGLGVPCHHMEAVDPCVVVIFMATELGDVPFGVTVLGLKTHVDPTGMPVHVRLTCWLKPLTGVTKTV